MTKTEFINKLDFDAAKNVIAKKLGISTDGLIIRPTKSGEFVISLKKVTGDVGSLFSGARSVTLATDNLVIKETKNGCSYVANIRFILKNKAGEYSSNIGRIEVQNNKFVFYTMSDLKKRAALKKAARSKKTTKTKTAKTA